MYFKAAFASSEKIMCFYGLTSREYPLITGSTYKNISCIFLIFLQILHKADYYNQSKQSITSRSSWSSNRSSFLGKKCLGGATNRNSKIGLHYVLRHISISLHAKFQGNRSGDKRLEKNANTLTHRNTHLNFIKA